LLCVIFSFRCAVKDFSIAEFNQQEGKHFGLRTGAWKEMRRSQAKSGTNDEVAHNACRLLGRCRNAMSEESHFSRGLLIGVVMERMKPPLAAKQQRRENEALARESLL
jgi:hypothetical protein